MTISSDQSRPENDAWETAIQKAANRLAQGSVPSQPVSELRASSVSSLRQALDTSVKILKPPFQPEDLSEASLRFAARHQEHIIAPQFVTALLLLKNDHNDEEGNAIIKQLHDRANTHGFFIMNYTDDMMSERLLSPNYVIAESWGRHPDPGNPLHSAIFPAADCQCWMPDAVANPNEHVDLPYKDGDQIFGKAAQKLSTTLAHCGEVKDITTMMGMNDLKLAGAARHEAFSYIRNVVNPTRGEYPINFMAASIAELSGIILPDGEQFLLSDVGHLSGIKNDRSIIIHTTGRNKGRLAYTLMNRTVPVILNGQTYQILVNWMYFIHDIQAHH